MIGNVVGFGSSHLGHNGIAEVRGCGVRNFPGRAGMHPHCRGYPGETYEIQILSFQAFVNDRTERGVSQDSWEVLQQSRMS